MNYVETSRMRHEEVRHEAAIHWILLAKPLLMTMVAAGVVAFLSNQGYLPDTRTLALGSILDMTPRSAVEAFPGSVWLSIAAISATAACAFAALRAFIRRATTEYVVTNRRIVAKWGWISRSTYEISIDRIEGAYVRQDFWGRMLGYGTVFVRGTGGGTAAFSLVTTPVGFRVAVAEAVEERQDERDDKAGRRREDDD